jgi:hypothetical protein
VETTFSRKPSSANIPKFYCEDDQVADILIQAIDFLSGTDFDLPDLCYTVYNFGISRRCFVEMEVVRNGILMKRAKVH